MLIVDSHVNRNIVHGCVVGDMVLDIVLGTLGDDLRDGVSVGIGLVVVDVEGDIALASLVTVWSTLPSPSLSVNENCPFLNVPPSSTFLAWIVADPFRRLS